MLLAQGIAFTLERKTATEAHSPYALKLASTYAAFESNAAHDIW